MNTYKTIATPCTYIYKIKSSKFLAHAYPIDNDSEFKAHLLHLKKEYYDATHHCYAYVIHPEKPVYRHSDDREPSGTAGIPIEGQLKSYQLYNIALFIIRYFGGTKLGTGGLKDSYKAAAEGCLHLANIIEKEICITMQIEFPYEYLHICMSLLKKYHAQIINQQLDSSCKIIFTINKALKKHLLHESIYDKKVHITEYQYI